MQLPSTKEARSTHVTIVNYTALLSELVSFLKILTHCGRVTQICVFTLQLCRTDDADLRF